MATMKTPGVYIVEKSTFPNSVVEAPTAIPAFIGITEKAANGADSLSDRPWKITSMTEFQQYFGGAPASEFKLSVVDNPENDTSKPFYSILSADKSKLLRVEAPKIEFSLYYQMVMFFANGGGTCYIVSVGTYNEGKLIDKDKVVGALTALKKEQEITMVLVPEATSVADCKDIQTQVLAHCGEMMNRFTILDVQPKEKENETMEAQIEKFRTNIGANYLSYGATYYPWLNTSVLSDKDINGTVLSWDYTQTAPDITKFFTADSQFPAYFKSAFEAIASRNNRVVQENGKPELNTDTEKQVVDEKTASYTTDELVAMKNNLHNALVQNFPDYQ